MQFLEKLENARKHRDIKLVTTERRKNYLVSELNFKNSEILMNNPVYLRLSILELCKY